MTAADWKLIFEANERARAAFNALTPEGRLKRLQAIGIFDANGELAPEYRAPEPEPARRAQRSARA